MSAVGGSASPTPAPRADGGPLILASASPRRSELLRYLVPAFDIAPSGVDETLDGPPAPEAAARLALRKARAVAESRAAGTVLAADTLVVVDGASLGKPADAADARAMLRRLSGREHAVITGVALVDAATGRERSTAVVSRVFMRELSADEIDAYVATREPEDKAGAYAIQGRGGGLVAALLGSYTNVVGLPLPAVRGLLAGRPDRDDFSVGPPAPGAAARGRAAPRAGAA